MDLDFKIERPTTYEEYKKASASQFEWMKASLTELMTEAQTDPNITNDSPYYAKQAEIGDLMRHAAEEIVHNCLYANLRQILRNLETLRDSGKKWSEELEYGNWFGSIVKTEQSTGWEPSIREIASVIKNYSAYVPNEDETIKVACETIRNLFLDLKKFASPERTQELQKEVFAGWNFDMPSLAMSEHEGLMGVQARLQNMLIDDKLAVKS